MNSLMGKVALVTGASSGIGRAIAIGLGEQGVALCLVSRRPRVLDSVVREVQERAPSVRCYQADLTVDEDIHTMVTQIEQEVDQIDILVHSAGVIVLGPLESAPVAHLDWQYRTNVRAPYLLTQALLPKITAPGGQVVFVNSSAGLVAKATVSQYAATKHALKAIADSLRAEINPRGVRVISIYPGSTASPMQEAVAKMQGWAYQPDRLLQPQDVAEMTIHALGLPWSAEVTDISVRPMTKSN